MEKQATRRFLGLNVQEVSLVDTPANELEFLVAKRHDQNEENSDMTVQATAQGASGDGAEATRVTIETADVTKAETAAVQSALGQVTALVEGIRKAVGGPGDDEEAGDDSADDESGESDDGEETSEEEVTKAARATVVSTLKSAGVKGKALKTALASYDAKVAKSLKSAKAKAAAVSASEDTIEATLDTIQKAKAFTPARIAAVTQALDTLQKLMMEVIGVGQSPSTKVPVVRTHSNPSTTHALVGTQKGMEDVMKALEGLQARVEALSPKAAPTAKPEAEDVFKSLTKTLDDISKRLSAVEGVRPAPKSEGGDDETKTETTQKSFWGGIL